MKYFKNTNNEIFAYDTEQVAQGYGKDLIAITDAEKDEILNPPKTSEQLKELARAEAKQIRDSALQSNTYSINTSVYQVRPQDLSNFSLAIQEGISVDWILVDNTVRLTTIAELQEILNAGITQGKAIWNTYTNTLKGI